MITSTYNSYNKIYTVYKDNKRCAILTRTGLILCSEEKSLYTIDEIVQMLDCCKKSKNN